MTLALARLSSAFRAMVRDRLRGRAQAAGLDGLLLLAPGNLAYATGWIFSLNERPMALWLPVAAVNLHSTPSYSIRFANHDVWDKTKGYNVLSDLLIISE